MFGLFKRKSEQPEEAGRKLDTGESRQYKAFAAQFQPQELTVLALTGAAGFSGGKTREDTLWTASIGLTAWMEEDGQEIHQGSFVLSVLGEERLLAALRRRAHPDSIIRCQVRVSEDGGRLLLLDLPESGYEPRLQELLEAQKKPVTFQEEGLGTFTLNRQVGWFETETDWLGTAVSLVFDQEEDRADCVRQARTLLSAAPGWDRRVREYAAGELLSSANDWAEEEEITREQFMERMELESIEIRGDGGFDFWFSDGDMFYGHSIRVSGDLENGPDDADMEG